MLFIKFLGKIENVLGRKNTFFLDKNEKTVGTFFGTVTNRGNSYLTKECRLVVCRVQMLI